MFFVNTPLRIIKYSAVHLNFSVNENVDCIIKFWTNC